MIIIICSAFFNKKQRINYIYSEITLKADIKKHRLKQRKNYISHFIETVKTRTMSTFDGYEFLLLLFT